MLRQLINVADKTLGAVSGTISGLISGSIVDYFFIYHNDDYKNSVYAIYLYFASLPIFMPLKAWDGGKVGFSEGLIAGALYAKTVYDELVCREESQEVVSAVKSLEDTLVSLQGLLSVIQEMQNERRLSQASLCVSTLKPSPEIKNLSFLRANLSLFNRVEDNMIELNRHHNREFQEEYDRRHGMVVCK